MNGADQHAPPTLAERDQANIAKVLEATNDFQVALDRAGATGSSCTIRLQLLSGGVLEIHPFDRDLFA